jgi:hypothetical protein
VSRPSLKLTRYDDRQPPGDVGFAVWNPIMASYEPMASLHAGLSRMDELAAQVWVIWVQENPARALLKDAPDPDEGDDSEWAEIRVSSQAKRVYETRTFDQHEWQKAVTRSAAVETICNEVGYVSV